MTDAPIRFDLQDPADAREDVRFGTLKGIGRVAVWPGTAPLPAVAHPALAAVIAERTVDEVPVYLESLPAGIRLIDAEPPVELGRYVVSQVLRALEALHAKGAYHGSIDERHVAVGSDGEVVLFGRGRRPGSANTDVLSAMALLPSGADITVPGIDAHGNAARMEDSLSAGARARLAGWVRTLSSGAVDEVARNLGPENDSTGLLDRYNADEQPDEDSSTQWNLGSTLWRTLAAPPLNDPPFGRFNVVAGSPSAAVAALLRSETPLRLDLPAVGPIESFVVDAPPVIENDDESTHTAQAPTADMLSAHNALKRNAPLDALTPRPTDIARRQIEAATTPTVAPVARSDRMSVGLIVGLGLGTVGAVAGLLWFMDLIG